MAVCISVTTFTACIVCLRMYTRMYLLKFVGKDDIMMCFAMACSIGMLSMQVYSCEWIDPGRSFHMNFSLHYYRLEMGELSTCMEFVTGCRITLS